MTEEIKPPKEAPKEAEKPPKPSPEPVPVEHKGTKEPPPPKVEPEPPALEPDKDTVIKELKDKLAKREEQLTALRKPLVDVLSQRGYQAQELNPLSIATLQKMVSQSVSSTTEGLPGTVPAPAAEAPKTLAEAREAEHKRFTESLEKKQKERWKDM